MKRLGVCLFSVVLLILFLLHPVFGSDSSISIRTAYGDGEFFDRATNQTFKWRGSVIVDLANQTLQNGKTDITHSTFNLESYDSDEIEQDLALMEENGYTVVRAFLNTHQLNNFSGNPGNRTPGINSAYLSNVKDFVARADAHGLRVYLVMPYFIPLNWQSPLPEDYLAGTTNSFLLSDTSIRNRSLLYQDIIRELERQGVHSNAIIGFDLMSELVYANQAPFNWTVGTVIWHGDSYDMSDSSKKQELMDSALLYFANDLVNGCRSADQDILFGMSFWNDGLTSPGEIDSSGKNIVINPSVLERSDVDFLEFHTYPKPSGKGSAFSDYMHGLPLKSGKPRVLGEFGITHSRAATIQEAQARMFDWLSDSCEYGFDGWLYWFWGTETGTPQLDRWWATMESGPDGATLNDVLSPLSNRSNISYMAIPQNDVPLPPGKDSNPPHDGTPDQGSSCVPGFLLLLGLAAYAMAKKGKF